MRNLAVLAATFVMLVALAACSPGAIFMMEGEYALTITVTESTNPTLPVGDTDSTPTVVTAVGDDVTMELGSSATLTGTRSGNNVTLTSSVGGHTIVMNLVWTSDDTFEGTGRVDYADASYVEFDVEGQAALSVTSLGVSGLVGLRE